MCMEATTEKGKRQIFPKTMKIMKRPQILKKIALVRLFGCYERQFIISRGAGDFPLYSGTQCSVFLNNIFRPSVLTARPRRIIFGPSCSRISQPVF